MAPPPPAGSPLPLPWQLGGALTPRQQKGLGGSSAGGSCQGDAVANQFGSLVLHTPSSASSPFGSEATLQVGVVGAAGSPAAVAASTAAHKCPNAPTILHVGADPIPFLPVITCPVLSCPGLPPLP